jgi:hypothetical protein
MTDTLLTFQKFGISEQLNPHNSLSFLRKNPYMTVTLLTSILPLIALVFITLFIVVTIHELGHAIPALLMTRDDVSIYIGSLGDPSRTFHFSIGRLMVFVKYNPLLWYKGCCTAFDYEFTINQKLFFVAGGPLASIIGTAGSWRLLSLVQAGGPLRIIVGSVFVVSLLITLSTLFPSARIYYTASGYPIHNDSYRIYRLVRAKLRQSSW